MLILSNFYFEGLTILKMNDFNISLIKNKILLTGNPGCGKTTLIQKVIDRLNIPVFGFYTQEIKKSGQRVGFELSTISKPLKKGVLAHVDTKSQYKVGKYGVDIETFEKIALTELEAGIKSDGLIVIDEIGKMELFSVSFKNLLRKLFDSDLSILATILYKPHPFGDFLKQNRNIKVIVVNKNNRDYLVDEIITGCEPQS